MMATAQIGVFACTAADDPEDDTENVSADDAGADDDEGTSDDDAADDAAADDDAADDDADAGAEGGDDDVADEADAGDEGVAAGDAGAADAGGEAMFDAGAEGALMGDAAAEGALGADAGGEGSLPEGDAGLEGGGECLGGGIDPALEAVDCAMFDACDPLYFMGGTWCWDMASGRRESVYTDFIGCVMAAELADPCTEEGDYVVSLCAADADARACVESDASCTAMAESCSEIEPAVCDASFAPLSADRRYAVTGCFDYRYTLNAETLGPDYEGCGYDLQSCLISPSGE
jgi:hypothetical protein